VVILFLPHAVLAAAIVLAILLFTKGHATS
jgi:hypothetical protein